jgi:hypothetical protein
MAILTCVSCSVSPHAGFWRSLYMHSASSCICSQLLGNMFSGGDSTQGCRWFLRRFGCSALRCLTPCLQNICACMPYAFRRLPFAARCTAAPPHARHTPRRWCLCVDDRGWARKGGGVGDFVCHAPLCPPLPPPHRADVELFLPAHLAVLDVAPLCLVAPGNPCCAHRSRCKGNAVRGDAAAALATLTSFDFTVVTAGAVRAGCA